jgi:hypothetical protein
MFFCISARHFFLDNHLREVQIKKRALDFFLFIPVSYEKFGRDGPEKVFQIETGERRE